MPEPPPTRTAIARALSLFSAVRHAPNTEQNPEYAIVAGLDLNGLGVVRALAGAGVPVVAIDTDLQKPAAATRYGIKLRISALSGDEFVNELLRLRLAFARNPVLFLTQEASVRAVTAAHAQLAPLYRFSVPSPQVMENLLDKIRFHFLAEQLRFPVPRAVLLTSAHNPQILRNIRYPAILKPAFKTPEYSSRFAKAYRVKDAEEAMRLWDNVRTATSRVIVQEWIEGGDSDIWFCLQYRTTTKAVASFVGRKLCQWPPLVGGTATCIPAPENEAAELTRLTDAFFSAVGFAGMGSMEYKRDCRDGRFYMVEPTVGRTDYQEEIAALNGVNIPLAAFCSELGRAAPSQTPPRSPCGWRDPIGYARARHAGAPRPLRELTRGITVVDAWFRPGDPAPWLALKRQSLFGRLSGFSQFIRASARCRLARTTR